MRPIRAARGGVRDRVLDALLADASAAVISADSLATTSKNTFKSYATASHAFTAPRAPTNSR